MPEVRWLLFVALLAGCLESCLFPLLLLMWRFVGRLFVAVVGGLLESCLEFFYLFCWQRCVAPANKTKGYFESKLKNLYGNYL